MGVSSQYALDSNPPLRLTAFLLGQDEPPGFLSECRESAAVDNGTCDTQKSARGHGGRCPEWTGSSARQ